MSQPKSFETHQFWTDENSVQYPSTGPNSPWAALGPPPGLAGHGGPSQQPVGNRFSAHGPVNGGAPPSHPLQGNEAHPYHGQIGAHPYMYTHGPAAPASSVQFRAQPAEVQPVADDSDDDLPPANKILLGVARSASKVAGSRRPTPDPKGKGKAKPRASTLGKRKASSPAPLDADIKKPKGRAKGTSNYSPVDIDALLDVADELLPLGGKAWNMAEDTFNAWAAENDRPSRTASSLEMKFKQMVKTTKPTGDAECPPHILRAQQIDDAMNDKAGSRDLDDDDIVDAGNVIELSDDEDAPGTAPTATKKSAAVKIKSEPVEAGPIARRPPSDRIRPTSRPRTNPNQDLLTNISAALDPEARQLRNESHANASFQANQILMLTSQLRECNRLADSLRTQLSEAERRRSDAEHRADKAELLSMFSQQQQSMNHHHTPYQLQPPPPPPPPPPLPAPARRRLMRQDIFYRDGGSSVRWVGGSDDDDDIYGHNDSPGTRRYTYDDKLPNRQPNSPSRRPGHSPYYRSSQTPHRRSRSPLRQVALSPRRDFSPLSRHRSPLRPAHYSVTHVSPSRQASLSTLHVHDNA